jgi:hypothetical protein
MMLVVESIGNFLVCGEHRESAGYPWLPKVAGPSQSVPSPLGTRRPVKRKSGHYGTWVVIVLAADARESALTVLLPPVMAVARGN